MVVKLCCTQGLRRTGPLSGFIISKAYGRPQAAE